MFFSKILLASKVAILLAKAFAMSLKPYKRKFFVNLYGIQQLQ